MRIAAPIRRACAPFRRFGADQQGVAVVEFAMILPIMLALYIGGVSVTEALSIDRKVIVAAHTVADLTARKNEEVTDASIEDILKAAAEVIVPYPSDKLTATVTSIQIDPDGKAKILWRGTRSNGVTTITRATGDVPDEIPAALKTPDKKTGLIWGEASYTYEPAIGYVVTGPINLSESTFIRPRYKTVVDYE